MSIIRQTMIEAEQARRNKVAAIGKHLKATHSEYKKLYLKWQIATNPVAKAALETRLMAMRTLAIERQDEYNKQVDLYNSGK